MLCWGLCPSSANAPLGPPASGVVCVQNYSRCPPKTLRTLFGFTRKGHPARRQRRKRATVRGHTAGPRTALRRKERHFAAIGFPARKKSNNRVHEGMREGAHEERHGHTRGPGTQWISIPLHSAASRVRADSGVGTGRDANRTRSRSVPPSASPVPGVPGSAVTAFRKEGATTGGALHNLCYLVSGPGLDGAGPKAR